MGSALLGLVRPAYGHATSVMGVVTDWVVLLLVVFLVFMFVRRWRRKYRAALAHRDQLVSDSKAYAELRARLSAASMATGGQVVLNVGSNGARGDGGAVGPGIDRCYVCGAVLRGVGSGIAARKEVVDGHVVVPGLEPADSADELGYVVGSRGADDRGSLARELRFGNLEALDE